MRAQVVTRLLVVVALLLGGSRAAHAAIVATPSPLNVGNVALGATGNANGNFTENMAGAAQTVQSFDLTTCPVNVWSIQTQDSLPVFINTTKTEPFTVTFKPTAPGAATCTIKIVDTTGLVVGTFTVTGTGTAPALSVLPASPVNVGSARVSTSSTTSTNLTVSNTGAANLVIPPNGFSFAGANPGDFSVTSPSTFASITILPGNNLTVTVQFAPSALGARNATMSIASNDPASPTTLSLFGVGTSAVINATFTTNFGTVNDGASLSENVNVMNNGAAALTVTGATITGASWVSFVAGNGCVSGSESCTFSAPLTVLSGTPATVPVKCTVPAGASGSQVAMVTIVSDTDPGGNAAVAMTCTAGQPMPSPSTTTIAFPNTVIGVTATAMSVKITNNGNVAYGYGAALTGVGAGWYAITSCTSGCTIAAGANATISVTFTPLTIGTAPAATLDISSTNAAFDLSDIDVTLTGTGTDPIATLTQPASGTTLMFSDTEVGSTATAQAIQVTNTGNTALTITSATLASSTNFVLTGMTGAQNVLAGATASWTVACKPTVFGNVNTSFTIISNGHSSSPINVTLQCNGLQGQLAVSPTSWAFGQANVGATATKSITLSNTGNVTVSGITGVFADTTLGYSVDATTPVPASLAAGSNASIQIDFKPTMAALGGADNLVFTGNWGGVPTTTTATEAVTGQGLTTGYQLFPSPLAFGDVRFDQPTSLTLSIRNNAEASFQLQLPTVAVTGTTTTGTFTLGAIVEHVGGTAITTWPHTMAANEQVDATVTVTPGTQLGALTGSVSTVTDIVGNQMIAITANSTTAVLAVDPGTTVTFASVDVQHVGSGATQNITLTNTGTAALDLTGASIMNADPTITITLPTFPAHVAAGTSLSIPVVYVPTVEGANTSTLVLQLHGALVAGGELMTETIVIDGQATDRHIAVASGVTFPATFREPGALAPTQTVTISNTGGAPLNISALTLTGDPAFTLVETGPLTIAGNSSMDLHLQFQPTTDTGSFTGDLLLVNDTTATPMTHVAITGTAEPRTIGVTPGSDVDLGTTYIGVAVQQTITITNQDPTNATMVRELDVTDGDDVFTIVTPDAQMLSPGGSASYVIEFKPTAIGDVTGTVQVLFDADTTPDATITLTGHGDKARGGYYDCSIGGGAGALPIGLALLAIVRRRRRRR